MISARASSSSSSFPLRASLLPPTAVGLRSWCKFWMLCSTRTQYRDQSCNRGRRIETCHVPILLLGSHTKEKLGLPLPPLLVGLLCVLPGHLCGKPKGSSYQASKRPLSYHSLAHPPLFPCTPGPMGLGVQGGSGSRTREGNFPTWFGNYLQAALSPGWGVSEPPRPPPPLQENIWHGSYSWPGRWDFLVHGIHGSGHAMVGMGQVLI